MILIILLIPLLVLGCSQGTGEKLNQQNPTAQNGVDSTRTPPSQGDRPTQTPTPVPTSALGVKPEDLRNIEIEFWHFLPEEQLRPLLRAFNQDNPWGINVKTRRFADPNELAAQLSGETQTRVVLGYPEQLLSWHQDELLVDLQIYVTDPEWGLTAEERADFLELFWEQDTQDGFRLGLPARRDAQMILYNQTWASELGYSQPPHTPERFLAQACSANSDLKQDNNPQNDGRGGWLVNTEPPTMLGWLAAFGSEPTRSGGRGYRFNTAASVEAFRYLKSLADRTCAWTSIDFYPDEPFAQREALFATASLQDLPYIASSFETFENKDQWTVLAFPTAEADPSLPVYGPSFALLAGPSAEELAGWLFITWMSSPETQAFWSRQDGFFPVRKTSRTLLEDYAQENKAWSNAWDLLEFAIAEPHIASWNSVQWALQDAGTQIFRAYFTPDRIQATLEELDRTAAELHRQEQE